MTPDQLAKSTQELLAPHIGDELAEQTAQVLKRCTSEMLGAGVSDIVKLMQCDKLIAQVSRGIIKQKLLASDNAPLKKAILDSLNLYVEDVNDRERILNHAMEFIRKTYQADMPPEFIEISELLDLIFQDLKSSPNLKKKPEFFNFAEELRSFGGLYVEHVEDTIKPFKDIEDDLAVWLEESVEPLKDSIAEQAKIMSDLDAEIWYKLSAALKSEHAQELRESREQQKKAKMQASSQQENLESVFQKKVPDEIDIFYEQEINKYLDETILNWCKDKAPDVIELLHLESTKSACKAITNIEAGCTKMKELEPIITAALATRSMRDEEYPVIAEKLSQFLTAAKSKGLDDLFQEPTLEMTVNDSDISMAVDEFRYYIGKLSPEIKAAFFSQGVEAINSVEKLSALGLRNWQLSEYQIANLTKTLNNEKLLGLVDVYANLYRPYREREMLRAQQEETAKKLETEIAAMQMTPNGYVVDQAKVTSLTALMQQNSSNKNSSKMFNILLAKCNLPTLQAVLSAAKEGEHEEYAKNIKERIQIIGAALSQIGLFSSSSNAEKTVLENTVEIKTSSLKAVL